MRISLAWLRDFVDLDASAAEIGERLTMAGLEVEGTETSGDDTILELNVTPNRPDCLSVIGIAREVAAAFGVSLKAPGWSLPAGRGASGVSVEIRDPDLCWRYTGRSIRNLRIGVSPDWMQRRLEACGIRAINSVVDITNYVLLELGHPLHAFDEDRLSGARIVVGRAGDERRVVTLDGMERPVSADMLLIWDAEQPVAIAGIMGGEGSSVDEATKNVFLESAYFLPASIRRTSKLLGLRSESSYRFERGTDLVGLEAALDRAAGLMAEICGGQVSGIVDVYPVKHEPRTIVVLPDRVNAIIGTSIENSELRAFLERLGVVTREIDKGFSAVPPSYRNDLQEEIDLIEEIARCYGYARIPVTLPLSTLSEGGSGARHLFQSRLRDSARKVGLTEVINYSFMNPADLDLLGIPSAGACRRSVEIRNPLRQEECLLRTTLVPGLLQNLRFNHARQAARIRLFELGRVFSNEGAALPSEELKLGGILFQDQAARLWKDAAPAFFAVKGMIEAIMEEMHAGPIRVLASAESYLHPGKSADILIGDEKIGYVGELSPDVIERLELKVRKPEIVVFELAVDRMMALAGGTVRYRPIPRFPAIDRDIAVIVADDIPAERIASLLSTFPSDLVERVELFDHFRGGGLPEGHKSLGFRITYRNATTTLTDEEVETLHRRIVDEILRQTGGSLRGGN